MSTIGGEGYGSGGGGAGGRIAIHTQDSNEYKGDLLAYGSPGTSTGDMGGPGTVFIEDRVAEFTYQSRLYLDGRDLATPKPVVVTEKNPRHADSEKPNTNDAHLDFEHLVLNNIVSLS